MENKKTIGIPLAMSYYNYYPFYYGFFNELGIEIVLSNPTTKKTISDGASLVVTETCLPIKVYVGHVLDLINKGVKNIFVPSIQSIAPKIYNCSKIRGLPDLIRNVVKGEFKIIDATLDKSEKNNNLSDFLAEIANYFNITDKDLIKRAQNAGFVVQNNFWVMMQNGLDFDNALKYATKSQVVIPPKKEPKAINVALIGHGYNIYDKRTCMDIFKKLENMEVGVYSAYQLTREQLSGGMVSLNTSLYWANQYEMTGCAGHYFQDEKIDGIITLTAFGCGPDSLMVEDIKRKSKLFDKPLLNLTIDEHTGEAGFITRIEAFCDMLYRSKRAKIIEQRKKIEEHLTKM
ncbi:MAG: hypothetical protein IJ877_00925 [Candidatus Gastranaerophilales bacterium]|nr:hypothetical protein [Candidatus Gastranaerophilales bacterium]